MFKVGDVVSVIDKRDNTIVAKDVTITKLETRQLPGFDMAKTYASLSAGYAVSVECLIKINSTT